MVWLFLVAAALYLIVGSKMLRTFGTASALVGAISFLVVLVLLAVVLGPLGRGFPRNCKTFGDLVKLALSRIYGNMAATHGVTSEGTVVQSLLLLVATETAIDIRSLSSETPFPEGLNIY